MNRRNFIIFSSFGLCVIGGLAILPTPFRQKSIAVIQPHDYPALERILPVILPSLKASPNECRPLIEAMEQMLLSLPLMQQRHFRALLSLFQNPIKSALLCGIWTSWSAATDAQIQRMLARWRNSRWTDLNQAYLGLVQLSSTVYFADPKQWQLSHYQGLSSQVLSALGRL